MPPKSLTKNYSGRSLTVSYDFRRCIHAEECIRVLGEVFNRDETPWIQPDSAGAEEVKHAVRKCPSGALGYAEMPAPGQNGIWPALNGPLYVLGLLLIVDSAGKEVHRDTRLALCRCGASANKPFCDNAHLKVNFQSAGVERVEPVAGSENGGVLRIAPQKDGPYRISGSFRLTASGMSKKVAGENIALCRCGASREKPYCDNTHRMIGFEAEAW